MVDRDEEVAAVREAISGATSGAGRLIFVLGEAGMGKSRLTGEARTIAAAAGLAILRGRAVDRVAPTPYRPLVEAVQPALLHTAGEEGAGGPHHRALRSLLTERQQLGEAGELVVAESLARMLGAMGGSRGCLLLLEDLHWADPETLAVVEYLADHLGDQRALVLASVRSGEASPAERLARTLRERRAADVISLQRLGPEGTERMLAACLGSSTAPAEVRRFVHEHAEGVPLFVEELVAGLVDSGALARSGGGWEVGAPLSPVVPLTYVEAIRRRLDTLSLADREVVLAAAILGRRFRWSLLPPITGQDEDSVLQSLRRGTESPFCSSPTTSRRPSGSATRWDATRCWASSCHRSRPPSPGVPSTPWRPRRPPASAPRTAPAWPPSWRNGPAIAAVPSPPWCRWRRARSTGAPSPAPEVHSHGPVAWPVRTRSWSCWWRRRGRTPPPWPVTWTTPSAAPLWCSPGCRKGRARPGAAPASTSRWPGARPWPDDGPTRRATWPTP